ncbi:hypothetical protein OV079_36055 [Nannocystis pusilla]|uniref:Lipoprotein n=1 Tax=Nannocystis pusilla TaxID=889268 RepID=A0A9X3J1N1_9BACT|nr:hypothetical protein [Nannocystis pusilla]MCY1010889.1 hypothetical protein [Nannocystis pusilla]
MNELARGLGRAGWMAVLVLIGCSGDDPGATTDSGTSTGTSTSTSTGETTDAPTTGEPGTTTTTTTGEPVTTTTNPTTTGEPGTTTTTSTTTTGVDSTSTTTGRPTACGDGILDPGELCDGDQIGGESCESQGFDGGELGCLDSCEFDTQNCSACGDGKVDAGEGCDDGNVDAGDGCDAECQVEACDPDGLYTVEGAPIAYTCCNGLVSVNITAFTFSGDGATIVSSPSNPIGMTGDATMCPDGDFANEGSIAGGCTETYALEGDFVDKDTWSGTYRLTFTGNQCSCFNGMLGAPCVNQMFPVTAKR